jgi:menaquinone-dependent protoporphyrinogen oxidase
MKVLVTAATRHGSTADIAAAVARVLQTRCIDVEEVHPDEVHDLSAYDAVVIGSAVYAGRWLESAAAMASRCARQLTERPVWMFSSGPIGHPATPADGPHVKAIELATGALEHRIFAGKLDKDGLGRIERTLARAVRAPDGDYRDWEQIHEWATEIADALSSAHASR